MPTTASEPVARLVKRQRSELTGTVCWINY
jgi:hypothetical protein